MDANGQEWTRMDANIVRITQQKNKLHPKITRPVLAIFRRGICATIKFCLSIRVNSRPFAVDFLHGVGCPDGVGSGPIRR
jgi:hypothetical protein